MSRLTQSSHKFIAGVLVLVSVCIILGVRSHTFNEPLERDITTFAVIGHELLDGRQLYSDLWDHKPPAIHLTFAFGELLAGYGPPAVFLLGVLAACLTLTGIFLTVFWTSRSLLAAGAAALLWSLVSGDLYLQANQPNTEAFINVFLIWGFALSAKVAVEGFTWKYCVSAAACWSMASLYKMVAVSVPALIVPITAVAIFKRGGGLKKAAAFAAVQLGIGLAAWSLVSGYFLATGRLDDFLDAVFIYNQSYARDPLTSLAASTNLYFWKPLTLGIAKGLVYVSPFGFLLLTLKGRWMSCALVLAYLVGCVLAIVMPGYFFPHYFQLLIPVLVMLIALGLASPGLNHEVERYLRLGTFSILVIVMSWQLRGQLELSPEEWSRVKYGDTFINSAELGQRLRRSTVSEQTILQLGAETGLYFYSQRKPAVGMFYDYPLRFGPFQEKYINRVMIEITETPPDILILGQRYADEFHGRRWSAWPDSAWKHLYQFIDANYSTTEVGQEFPAFLLLRASP